MKKIMAFLLILLFIIPLSGENIILKNGTKIVNVQIVKTNEHWVFYQMSNGKKTKVSQKAIAKIDKIPFNPEAPSKLIEPDISKIIPSLKKQEATYYPNLKLLPVSFISFALGYDYYKQAQGLKDASLAKIKTLKRRKEILCGIFFTAGIINTFFIFKRVKIKASPTQISLSYKF